MIKKHTKKLKNKKTYKQRGKGLVDGKLEVSDWDDCKSQIDKSIDPSIDPIIDPRKEKNIFDNPFKSYPRYDYDYNYKYKYKKKYPREKLVMKPDENKLIKNTDCIELFKDLDRYVGENNNMKNDSSEKILNYGRKSDAETEETLNALREREEREKKEKERDINKNKEINKERNKEIIKYITNYVGNEKKKYYDQDIISKLYKWAKDDVETYFRTHDFTCYYSGGSSESCDEIYGISFYTNDTVDFTASGSDGWETTPTKYVELTKNELNPYIFIWPVNSSYEEFLKIKEEFDSENIIEQQPEENKNTEEKKINESEYIDVAGYEEGSNNNNVLSNNTSEYLEISPSLIPVKEGGLNRRTKRLTKGKKKTLRMKKIGKNKTRRLKKHRTIRR